MDRGRKPGRRRSVATTASVAACVWRSYTPTMHRTTIVFDEVKLARARTLLGTHGIKDTFERAIDEILALDARQRVMEQLRTLEGLELDKPDVMASAWR